MNTTVTPTPAQVIEAQRTDQGIAFELPFDAAAVAKMEAVDLDLLITLKDGQQFILTQAGLLAMTQPDSVLRYAGGLEVLASEEVKNIGAMQSMDANTLRLAGNFRLASLELEENDIEKVSGTGFGLGQELVDITAKLDQSSQKIEQMLQSLEQATQASSLASSGDEPPPAVSTGVKRLSKNTNPDLYSSPTPGTPPELVKKEEQTNENTSNNTNNNVNNNTNNNTDNSSLPAKVSFSLLAANKEGVSYQDNALGKTEVRQLLGKSTVELTMSENAQSLEFTAGKVENQLVLADVPTTNSLILNINDQQPGFKIPDGLTINGQAVTAGTPLTIDVTGMTNNEVPLNLQWEEGSAAANSNFQMTVAYVGPNGATNLKTITFTGNPDNAYTLDANGEPRQFIASQADNLIVTANDADNTITTGNGNDTIKGSGGADTINGGAGKDSVDYGSSSEAITLNVANGTGTGGQAQGDQLSNIENLIGSTSLSDTLDFTGATTAVNVNFITGTTNQKLNGSDESLTFSGFENAVGSANDDVFVANSVTNHFKGGEGSDTVSYNGSTAVVVNLHTGQGFDGNARGDSYESIENVIGSSGNDTFVASAATNTFTGNGGVDRVSYVHSTAGVTVNLSSGQGTGGFAESDKYVGIVNATGSDHNDTFVANNQGNNFQGGLGFDTVSYANAGGGVTVNLHGQSGSGSDATADTYSSIESAIGSAHNDTFIASSDKNHFDGLGGINTLSYANSTAGVNLNLATGAASGGHAEGDTFANIQNLTGSAHNDVLTGDANNNLLLGGAGSDQFFGGAGTDTVSYQDSAIGLSIDVDNVIVGAGRGTSIAQGDVIAADVERVQGSNGDDTFFSTRTGVVLDGGAGFDSIDFSGVTAGVTVNLGDASKFVSIERVVGSAHNDTLTASNSGSTLLAGNGNDTVIGGSGADFINMLTNNTTLVGDSVKAGAGNDTVWINAAHVGGTITNLDGEGGFDTLRVMAGATLDLGSLNAVNFERVDLRADGGATQVSLSSADIRALVNSGAGNNVLTLRLDSNDSYVIDAAPGETVVQGQSVSFYNGSIAQANLVAQVNFEYV